MGSGLFWNIDRLWCHTCSDYLKPIAEEEKKVEEAEKVVREEQERIYKQLSEGNTGPNAHSVPVRHKTQLLLLFIQMKHHTFQHYLHKMYIFSPLVLSPLQQILTPSLNEQSPNLQHYALNSINKNIFFM